MLVPQSTMAIRIIIILVLITIRIMINHHIMATRCQHAGPPVNLTVIAQTLASAASTVVPTPAGKVNMMVM